MCTVLRYDSLNLTPFFVFVSICHMYYSCKPLKIFLNNLNFFRFYVKNLKVLEINEFS